MNDPVDNARLKSQIANSIARHSATTRPSHAEEPQETRAAHRRFTTNTSGERTGCSLTYTHADLERTEARKFGDNVRDRRNRIIVVARNHCCGPMGERFAQRYTRRKSSRHGQMGCRLWPDTLSHLFVMECEIVSIPSGANEKMRFHLIDRVHEIEVGKKLTASKLLTLGEEYLADHFPSFPVMPGVMMLQAVTEASAWLWRASSDFKYSVVVLREVKNVKYGTFMQPGFTLELTTELVKSDETTATFRGKGNVQGGGQTVNAQIVLHGYNVKDRWPQGEATDIALRQQQRDQWVWLTRPQPLG